MNRTPSTLYRDYPNNAPDVIAEKIEIGLQKHNQSSIPVFFRADDIGVVSESFTRLMSCFSRHEVPLCLAVVPVWLTEPRWTTIGEHCNVLSHLWCWHQHGWNHRNHQHTGKKCEFGSDRTKDNLARDIIAGRDRLQKILGTLFSPFFTPPWNRCSNETLKQLKAAGFKALSRDTGATSEQQRILTDLPINVDLHTRREPDSASCLEKLAEEFEAAAGSSCIGIMIHHQRMNDNAFRLLEGLLELVSRTSTLRPVRFNDFL